VKNISSIKRKMLFPNIYINWITKFGYNICYKLGLSPNVGKANLRAMISELKNILNKKFNSCTKEFEWCL
jgi:hypothetical protein